MFGVLPGLGEIRIRLFQHRVLIAMPELFLQTDVSGNLVILGLSGAFGCILVDYLMGHDENLVQ